MTEIYEANLTSHRYVHEKGRSILIDNCRYSSLGHLNWQVEVSSRWGMWGIWNHVNKLFVLCCIKIHWSCPLNGSLYSCMILQHQALVIWKTLFHWVMHFFWMLIYLIYIKTIIFVNITTDVIRKVSCQSNGERYNFLLKNSNFITGNNYCQFYFFKWQTHFVHSGENICQTPRL